MARILTQGSIIVEETPGHGIKILTPGGVDPEFEGEALAALADFIDDTIVGSIPPDGEAPADTDEATDDEGEDGEDG